MKTNLTEQELIELARLAPVVEPQIEGSDRRIKKDANMYSTVEKFVEVSGLKSGRNECSSKVIYDAYYLWADTPVGRKAFNINFNRIIKKIENNNYKLNMKPITLLEIIKELKRNEKE